MLSSALKTGGRSAILLEFGRYHTTHRVWVGIILNVVLIAILREIANAAVPAKNWGMINALVRI